METSISSFFLQGAALGISAALSPGPFQSLVIAESLAGGFRRGAPVTFAPLIADIPIAGVLVFAMSQVPAQFLDSVRIAGAALLLYLAGGMVRTLKTSGGDQHEDEQPTPSSVGRGLFLGVMMLFLSPGSYLYWSLINGPILLKGLAAGLSHAFAFLASFYFFSIGGLLIIAWVLSRAGQLSPSWRRGLQTASLLLLGAVAAYLIIEVLRT